jgi:hypothetical protein
VRHVLGSRRTGLVAGALACLIAALVLILLAVDIGRWQSTVAADDVRYRVRPGASDLWDPPTFVPYRAGERLAGISDDLELRRALRSLRLSRLEDPTVSDPELALRRNIAQARLEAIVAGGGDNARRSRAAGLLGVLGLARLVSESQDREALLQSVVADLQLAIALDPGNDEAKFNLELALQRGRGIRLEEASGGGNPTPGGAGAKGAGAGDAGTGY